jgi:hypothetical protein
LSPGRLHELTFNPAPGINDGSGPIVLTNFMSLLADPSKASDNLQMHQALSPRCLG